MDAAEEVAAEQLVREADELLDDLAEEGGGPRRPSRFSDGREWFRLGMRSTRGHPL